MGFFQTTIVLVLLTVLQILTHAKGNLIRPTPKVYDGEAVAAMPAPTSPPTRGRFGFMNEDMLFPRQASEPVVCGYKTWDPEEPLVCPSDQRCAYDQENGGNYGPVCCPIQTDGQVIPACATSAYVACVDYGSAINTAFTPTAQTTYERTWYCGSDYPICGTLLMSISDPVSLDGTYTSFFCGNAESWTVSVYKTTTTSTTSEVSSIAESTESSTTTEIATSDDTAGDSSTTSNGAVASSDKPQSSPTRDPSPATSSEGSGSSSDPKPAAESTASTSTGDSNDGSDDGSNTAAIAGGVGGGVGGVLAIAGVIGYLVYRKRKQRKEKIPEIAS